MLQIRRIAAILIAVCVAVIATQVTATEPHGRAYLFRGMIDVIDWGMDQLAERTTYLVPLWALTQRNKVLETVALTEGQRIAIPNHIGPKLPSSPAQNPGASQATNEN